MPWCYQRQHADRRQSTASSEARDERTTRSRLLLDLKFDRELQVRDFCISAPKQLLRRLTRHVRHSLFQQHISDADHFFSLPSRVSVYGGRYEIEGRMQKDGRSINVSKETVEFTSTAVKRGSVPHLVSIFKSHSFRLPCIDVEEWVWRLSV